METMNLSTCRKNWSRSQIDKGNNNLHVKNIDSSHEEGSHFVASKLSKLHWLHWFQTPILKISLYNSGILQTYLWRHPVGASFEWL